ncbi:MAG: hypothetical protein DKM50_03345 [Candidatus Margulisiibacteriota bacterium]|nr:MAG: hypothetical protein A2X43_09485 [Candidatus Margulisbacteria bacterium GWD2_39_127]OGI02879.1 MAG: hypothetical protein A2X42_02280 [Candidatus Margulisbacteria bacterium GWF2_38_17]OGI09660.1 MAG: hypothetical protein A2X41_04990 [Candidatus Margulisbacteria bacterium GWE2_39_32]PZM83014.1 MAG: hypothetical protein DKM50_03345 [Candidatus Margulisiibacteriota bacterium]HAR62174.1 hypothetical protein [Candidatus Margulisiibacteriota bacterium]
MKRKSIKVILCILIVFAIVVLNQLPLFKLFHWKLTDLKFVVRGPIKTPTNIVIIAIDDESIAWLGTWPWPRNKYAQLVDQLKLAGAKLIFFDILFDSPTSFDPDDDVKFAQSIKKSGNVLLAAYFKNTENNSFVRYVQDPFNPPIKLLKNSALDIGMVDISFDKSQVIRKIPMLFSGDIKYPNLTLQAVRYIQADKPPIKHLSSSIVVGKYAMPISQDRRFVINYRGGAKSFPYIPFDRVIDGSFIKKNPNFLKDKIVLIGATAIELQDYIATPFSNIVPGVEMYANAIQTVLDRNYLYESPPWFDFLVVLSLCIISIKFFLSLSSRRAFVFFLACTIVIMAVDLVVFLKMNYILKSFEYFSALLFPFIGLIGYRYYKEEEEKRYVKSVFSQYVDPSVVNKLLEHPSRIILGGEKKQVSIFFSDIRAFTTFSERHSPEVVVEYLNEYLDAMTKVIFEHKGTLDKYVGDEIMAIYGAPLEMPDHAKVAVEAALSQLDMLQKINEKRAREGRDQFGIGMGIHTGEVVIGNIGSTMHKDYTVIGDSVNLAARLESTTRNYGTKESPVNLIISEDTYKLVKDFFICEYLDEIIVKGKTIPVNIYSVVGRK